MAEVCIKYSCGVLAVLGSIIVGVVAAILRYTAVITVTPAFLWVVLGVAVVALATMGFFAVIGNSGVRSCIANYINLFLLGVLGSVLFSVILLAVAFVATSVLGAIFTGILLAAASLSLTSSACILNCIVRGCNQ